MIGEAVLCQILSAWLGLNWGNSVRLKAEAFHKVDGGNIFMGLNLIKRVNWKAESARITIARNTGLQHGTLQECSCGNLPLYLTQWLPATLCLTAIQCSSIVETPKRKSAETFRHTFIHTQIYTSFNTQLWRKYTFFKATVGPHTQGGMCLTKWTHCRTHNKPLKEKFQHTWRLICTYWKSSWLDTRMLLQYLDISGS